MSHSLTWDKGQYHIHPWILDWINNIRAEEIAEYYNETRGRVINDIFECVSPGEVRNNYTGGYGVEVKPERQNIYFTKKVSWDWEEKMHNGDKY